MEKTMLALLLLMMSLGVWAQPQGRIDHLPYLHERLASGQLDALESLLSSLPQAEAERLRWLLLQGLSPLTVPSQAKRAWVSAQAQAVAQEMTRQQSDGFWVFLPRNDYPALARRLLQGWQRLDWQCDYRTRLQAGTLRLHQLYHRRNAQLEQQQAALLAVVQEASLRELAPLVQELTRSALYLPDNQLAYRLLERSGDAALFRALWLRPADAFSRQALGLVARFYRGGEAGELLLAAARVPALHDKAMLALGALRPLPDPVRDYLQKELGIGPGGVSLARLLKPRSDSLQLILLADRLLQERGAGRVLPEPGRP